MSTPDFGALLSGHRKYFQSGATRSAKWREEQLIALRAMMKDHAEEFLAAVENHEDRHPSLGEASVAQAASNAVSFSFNPR